MSFNTTEFDFISVLMEVTSKGQCILEFNVTMTALIEHAKTTDNFFENNF